MGRSPWSYRGKQSGGKRPPDTETQNVVPEVGGGPVAVGRAEVLGKVGPGTAANHTATCVATLTPHGTVRWRSVVAVMIVAVMIGVLDPLPDVAVHVVEAKGVGLLLGYRLRLDLRV